MSIIYQLSEPYALNEKGKRSNNEDSIFPKKGEATKDDRVFLVCDGVGGQAKGEIASKIVSETFGNALHDSKVSEKDFIESVLHQIEDELQNYTSHHSESVGMATTLTMVHFHEDGVSVAHIGDSRIYQIRNGQIIYKSQDHSFVNELIKAGVISPEQAATHPQRNVITRAIQGSEKRVETEAFVLQDIAPNDYFFLCTDGILESVNDSTLVEILSSPLSNGDKINKILALCEDRSRDNFSCYLIQVAECQGTPNFVYDKAPTFNYISANAPDETLVQNDNNDFYEPITTFQPKYTSPIPEPPVNQPVASVSNVMENPRNVVSNIEMPTVESFNINKTTKPNTLSKWIAGSFIVMALAGGGSWYFFNQNKTEKSNTTEEKSEITPLQTTNPSEPIINIVDTNSALLTPSVLNNNTTENENTNDIKPKNNTKNNDKETKQPEQKPEEKPQEPTKNEKLEIKSEFRDLEKDEPLGNSNSTVKKEIKDPKSITTRTGEVVNKKNNN